MSKTLDDLLSDFDAAVLRAQSANREDLPAWAHRRAGLVAVVRALRDESYACDYGDEWLRMLNEILGDAGEKVMDYVCNDVRVIITQGTAYCAPATDPAPDVCEWTVKGRSYTYTEIRTQCGDDVVLSLFATAGRIGTCGKCHRPIKFTEAKT